MLDRIKNYNYGKIRIGIASPEKILAWSYGEVLRPETINYRTLRPEKGGLFCEKIFGTTKEWECFCGKFKSIRYKGVVCDRCGVEVTHFKVRRERVGHVELSSPVVHIWFYKAVPSRIGLLLDLSIIALKSVVHYEKYIVTDPGNVDTLKKNQLLTEEEYYECRAEYDNDFQAGIGAEVIRDMLMDLDLEAEAMQLRERISNMRSADKRKLIRLSLLEDFINSNNRPEWMVMTVIPVIPPELRPMVQLEGGRFATSDINDLYRRLINRNNRLKKLIALKAPDIIVKNEKRMLQEAVDALFDNSRRKASVKGAGNRPLKSLSDVLKGKQGRFRQNLLGKRVDYSGRSVIVVGPELKLHQCGLPRKMALELFKPFIMRKLVERKYVYNIKSAKRLIDAEQTEVWNILEQVVKEHPVMLNRAPTLHRLGMQAFEPVLTSEKAIRLHPLVCAAYNADFDGDQMAVHIPLSSEAQIEAWILMLSSKNLLDPANGEPIVNPSQDMVLGAYNLTFVRKNMKGEGKTFASKEELYRAMENDCVDLQAEVKVYLSVKNNLHEDNQKEDNQKEDNQKEDNRKEEKEDLVTTSCGRLLFSEVLPDGMPIIDKVLDERVLKQLVSDIFKRYGNYQTAVVLDKIKDICFHYSTIFCNTISVSDILIPAAKASIIDKTSADVKDITKEYQNGILTEDERYQKTISAWTFANEQITQEMITELEKDQGGANSLYIMSASGARGSKQQVRQLAGMRGLMAKPSGDIIDLPIVSNFKEGLTVLEYFISTHGARKGLSDTALKTADAGYLTRKLVDIAQDLTIELFDCGTINGIDVYPIKVGDEVIENLSDRVIGRFTGENVINPYTEEIIVADGTLVTEDIGKKIDALELEKVCIRAVVTCDAPRGICQKCYGINLANNRLVDIGEPVGILASQSIGQPGTQLTMRTFHIGGTASSEVRDPEFRFNFDTVILDLPNSMVVNKNDKIVVPRRGYMTVATVFDCFKKEDFKTLSVNEGQRVKIGDVIGVALDGNKILASKVGFIYINKETNAIFLAGISYKVTLEIGGVFNKGLLEFIKKNEVVYKFDPITEPIISEIDGVIRFQDIILNKTLKEEVDEYTGVTIKRIMESKEEQLQPKIIIVSEGREPVETDLPDGTILQTRDGAKVNVGESIAGKTRVAQKTTDITGGLPRVQELFEARNPVNVAVIAELDGEVEIGPTLKGKRQVFVKNKFDDTIKHIIPSGKALTVRNSDQIKAGETLCEGNLNPHDILRVSGEIALYEFILQNVQEIYKHQGVHINDKHIGVIIKQMLRKVEVLDPGDTAYIKGDIIDKYRLMQENRSVIEEGGQAAVSKKILLGLTKASLNTESFISSASFQETTKVLTNAAITNSFDELKGLKENVIIGHKIPAGTGKNYYNDINIYKSIEGDLDFINSEHDEDGMDGDDKRSNDNPSSLAVERNDRKSIEQQMETKKEKAKI